MAADPRRHGDGHRRRHGVAAMRARLVARAVAGLLAFLAADAARAQPVATANPYVCNDLAAKLRSLPKAPSTEADRWASAIAEQQQAIATNRTALARCGAETDPRCGAIVERGRQMTDNLARLRQDYARLGGGRATGSPERTRIEAAMAQMGCGRTGRSNASVGAGAPEGALTAASGAAAATGGAVVRTPPTRAPATAPAPNFFTILFGGAEVREAPPAEEEETTDPLDDELQQSMSGSYRTLCVRTCDGYFFPISFNATRSRFPTDANVCKALCPDAETRLYVHANPGQEAEDAVSIDDGEPLTRLPNAFLYRTRRVEGCGCGRPDPRLLPLAAGGAAGLRAARGIDASPPLPRPRPDPDQDPETQAATLSGLDARPVAPPASASAAAPAAIATAGEPPKVRQVGPKYYSDR